MGSSNSRWASSSEQISPLVSLRSNRGATSADNRRSAKSQSSLSDKLLSEGSLFPSGAAAVIAIALDDATAGGGAGGGDGSGRCWAAGVGSSKLMGSESVPSG
eukprot:CAMPEP_0115337344 /NCGR_PEP_ID=MMETSP0270-20121206/89482_1 /TAXON_ID=71861 /ORGANISM="Scrippsiella trochoidea, Strain CCMP3099" /LENGTH=102 /DNA_ID=CAMNT_0002758563 /DNA_START=205 /DNA_END=513 /DNA_ORIENTATION=-